MRFIAADIIYPVSSGSLKEKVICAENDGLIRDLIPINEIDPLKIERHEGFICPGFVNAHCHLELSFMKGKIMPGDGLHNFIKEVEKLKKPADEKIGEAIREADEEMYRNGIVAVGDVCNTPNSFALKKKSRTYYHNFIEVYAFDETKAEAAFARGTKLLEEAGKNSSITPHAPYSASKKLLELIAAHVQEQHKPLTIHMQETADEDLFFKEKKGSIPDRLNYFGIPTANWTAPGISSLQYTLPQLPQQNKVQLVHNTFTPARDILFAQQQHKDLYWCFCPNANLYIEGTTPHVDFFRKNNCIITLGTDSYASNWQLSILGEIRSLKTKYPLIDLEEYLGWATLNGARFLGIEDRFGSIEKNKRPGLNLISPNLEYVTKLI